MIMKLKSKDEITVKLVEKLGEKVKELSISDSEWFELNGEINMLKWVLGIPQDYTRGEINNDWICGYNYDINMKEAYDEYKKMKQEDELIKYQVENEHYLND